MAKRRGSARAEMPAQFRVSRQPRLGSVPQSQELRRAAIGTGKVIMKDLAPMAFIALLKLSPNRFKLPHEPDGQMVLLEI